MSFDDVNLSDGAGNIGTVELVMLLQSKGKVVKAINY